MGERPHVNIQLLPMKGTPVPGSVALLTLPQGERGAYTEGFSTDNYTEEPAEVMRFQRVHDLLQQGSLGVRASLELMRFTKGELTATPAAWAAFTAFAGAHAV
ncbi:Scr1 family TA system antitoxin-like transcriptional regulator [Streptomyces sp. NPDC046237]|uniref:Scr1 family TA system antitoxin-like transcriptional regulator n=1 Tax=Streptomyces sp. NPDC046237 TaxID=3154914 RepID=UPI00340269D9